MSASFPNLVRLALTTTLQDLGTATPSNKIRTAKVRYANVGAGDASADLVVTDGTTVITRAKNYPIPYNQAGSAPDMEEKLFLPVGWKIQGKASANNVVEASLEIIEADLADFI